MRLRPVAWYDGDTICIIVRGVRGWLGITDEVFVFG